MIIAKLAVLYALSGAAVHAHPFGEGGADGVGCPLGDKMVGKHTTGAPRARFKKPIRSGLGDEQRRLDCLEEAATPSYSNQRVGDGGCIPEGGYQAVRDAIVNDVLTTSQDFWPADFDGTFGTHYGGLFIRLAWHCNGTYRLSDGRGGCDGADIRFDPVKSWPDNASLDMAQKLLQPIKDKFGSCLSWGDLIVLAGDAAMVSMGAEVVGFCGGRIDNPDGSESLPLGPSAIQQKLLPCGPEACPEGELCFGCEDPLGAVAVGLIYVNPEGAEGKLGEFQPSADSIRDVFGRMGFDDEATVAAIGGGHTFGKSHGACRNPGGPGFCPGTENTWEDKFTSGLELTWTQAPTSWTNLYFKNLFAYNWTQIEGPGGAIQFKPDCDCAPDIGMYTTDIALITDPEYRKHSREYADNLNEFTKDFAEVWYQLMTRDVGPRGRCLGDELPPTIQAFESKLAAPRSSSSLPDYVPARKMIQESIDSSPENLAAFASLALACSNTFRATDYRGGCNGARIRFLPEREWESNKKLGTSKGLTALEPIKEAFPSVSYADLIVLAGHTAVESGGGTTMSFCGGRVDADDGDESIGLEPVVYNDNAYASLMYSFSNKGISMERGVALFATPCDGSVTEVSNKYFKDLLTGNTPGCMPMEEVLLEGDFKHIVKAFALDNYLFLAVYASGWNYMMTNDFFDGPTANLCQGVSDPTLEGEEADEQQMLRGN